MLSLFTRTKSTDRQTPVDDGQSVQADETLTAAVKGRQPLKRPGKMTRQDEEKVYHASPSIIDFLPWAEFLDEEQCLLLDDGVSVGAVYDVTPVATEGRTEERLEQIRDSVEDALQDSFDEHDVNPWSCSSSARTRTTLTRTWTGCAGMSNHMHSARRLPTPGWVKWSAISAVSPGLRDFLLTR